MTLSRQKIEDLWNTDVFPFWDRHWDYASKKPIHKSTIARGLEALCCCFSRTKKDPVDDEGSTSGFRIKTSMLDSLWKLGLPENSRKTLWPLVIGNNLAITPIILEYLKKRIKVS